MKSSQPAVASGRRDFLKQGATAAAATLATTSVLKTPVYGQNQAPSTGRVIGANDRIVVGVIGLQRGKAHVGGHASAGNVEVGYVCDVDSARLAEGQKLADSKKQTGPTKAVTDYRRILEDKNVDAISIAAPNFWQAIMTIQGCEAGKHVYVEKPGSHNAFEAEAMVAVAKKSNRLVQMGNQRRSYPMIIEAMGRLREGAIGNVRYSRCWYESTRGGIGKGKVAPVPSTLDWKLWQGPCPERPFKDNMVHYNWHWVWFYGGGELANNGIHTLDLTRWGLGAEYPKRVSFLGARYHYQDDQETPDTGSAIFDFGTNGASWDCSSCNARKGEQTPAVAFYGDKGSLLLSGGNDYTLCDMDGKVVDKKTGERASDVLHFRNFAEAIRGQKSLNSPISEGQKSTMLCHLGNLAYRTGYVLNCDPKTGRVIDNPAAMGFWKREYREGWEPKLVT